MKHPLVIKLSTIALLMLLLMIPINMINGLINERKNLQQSVVDEIAKSAVSSQKIVGPVLVVPYTQKTKQWKVNTETNVRFQEDVVLTGQLYFLPEAFEVDGKITNELRSRGIYDARLYHADNNISGHFDVPMNYGINENFSDYEFTAPYLSMGIKDIRGIDTLDITFNSTRLNMEAGSKLAALGDGVHAFIQLPDAQQKSRLNFALHLQLSGTETLSIAPVGRDSRVKLSSEWPHPSFIGNYLPTEHIINDAGFSADWRTSYFSSNMAESFNACIKEKSCEMFESRYFGVSLIDPVDQYVKSNRAIKYALLFVALTFAGFFLFEVIKCLAIHPVQYGLVGLALAFFYLLLLSLSEHIAFWQAYLISSACCILLIGFYVSYVLQSIIRSGVFSLLLVALYGMLYALLRAEDYALLMGSILLFGLLGVFMVLTRELDWYAVGKAEKL